MTEHETMFYIDYINNMIHSLHRINILKSKQYHHHSIFELNDRKKHSSVVKITNITIFLTISIMPRLQKAYFIS